MIVFGLRLQVYGLRLAELCEVYTTRGGCLRVYTSTLTRDVTRGCLGTESGCREEVGLLKAGVVLIIAEEQEEASHVVEEVFGKGGESGECGVRKESNAECGVRND